MFVKRISRIIKCIFKSRYKFNIQELKDIQEDEDYILDILPFVARSFSLSIMVLPKQLILPAAIGYCYCRILDTFEDMIPDEKERINALIHLPKLLSSLIDKKPIESQIAEYHKLLVCSKEKDHVYCLLVEEIERIHRLFMTQQRNVQLLIIRLIDKMSKGMCNFATLFKEDEKQISEKAIRQYCKSVLGYPLIFICQLMNWYRGKTDFEHVRYKKEIIDIGVFIQLANVTRDIEEDLVNKVVYHNLLIPYKNKTEKKDLSDPILQSKIKKVRQDIIVMALNASSSYPYFFYEYFMDSISIRLSMLIFLKFTEIFYRNACYNHFQIGGKSSVYVMIIKCILYSLTTQSSYRVSICSVQELQNLRLELMNLKLV